jgi:hypothetical protein
VLTEINTCQLAAIPRHETADDKDVPAENTRQSEQIDLWTHRNLMEQIGETIQSFP